MKGLKVDEIREMPLAEVSARQLSSHIPWLGQDPTQFCQSIMDGIFFASCKFGFKAPSALFCQCCSGLTCCIDLGLFPEELLSTDHRLCPNAAVWVLAKADK